ncbi:MAG: PepSY-associated TM helix domain-containing protein, partial [Allosphingosinicella sp.]
MAQSTVFRLRSLWLQVHKWIGLLLAVLIIPISLTGSALVWHDWLDETLHPGRYAVSGAPALTPAGYADAARRALGPGERVATIRFPEGEGPVMVSANRPTQPGGGRPVRTNVWLDPADGRVLDTASSNAGAVQVMHVLHGSLMVPGLGRQIVGWVGVAMFLSCLTGLWLWWPIAGSLRRGFRWKRQNSTSANLHHQMGFWILLPLAMLSFTGAWISFPGVVGRFEASQPKGGGGGPDRARAMRARPRDATARTPDEALALAQLHATGPLVTVTWPTDQAPEWKFGFAREGGPAEVEV